MGPTCRLVPRQILMIDTVPIIYNGGAYGTYVEWCLTMLLTKQPLIEPFTSIGTSHNFVGHQVPSIQGWRDYIKNNPASLFVRFHPKTQKEESISDNLDEVSKTVRCFVYVYPDQDSTLLHLNNFYFKSYDWWDYNLLTEESRNKIFENWPVLDNTDVDSIPTWIKREFLSYHLMPAWLDQLDWYLPDQYHNPKCHWVFISQLMHDFESTLEKMLAHIGMPQYKLIQDLVPYHKTNLGLQQYLDQDKVCQNIILAVTNNSLFEWSPLPLPSEAWIQWSLRNLGWEIQCDGLDKFPTNSVQLQKLLYLI